MFKDDISEDIKSERWHKLNDKLLESLTKRNKMMLGKIEEVLIA
jgi:tRNA A37 methylthiotransferase MiaB